MIPSTSILLIIGLLSIIITPSESCDCFDFTDFPLVDETFTEIGDIQCDTTVSGTTARIPFSNFFHLYRLSVEGANCMINIASCTEELVSFGSRQIQVYDADRVQRGSAARNCGRFDSHAQLLNFSASSSECTPWYIRIGSIDDGAGDYNLTVECSECTPCVAEEESMGTTTETPCDSVEQESCDCGDDDSSEESTDDAKADFAKPDDDVLRYVDEDEDKREVTLRVADMVWENIYGAIIVCMVCCGVFCFMFSKINKQYE